MRSPWILPLRVRLVVFDILPSVGSLRLYCSVFQPSFLVVSLLFFLKSASTHRMTDVFWTLNFYMKDAPSGEKFIEERMDKDLICYFDIIGLIEKQGYTSMDYIYCKRNGHGRHRSELVEIISDLDVSRMVCEHEVDQKLSFYVAKQTNGLNTRIRRSGQVPIGASADVERRKALSDERVTGSDYDTESSHETDHEAQGVEHHAMLEDIKRRRGGSIWTDCVGCPEEA